MLLNDGAAAPCATGRTLAEDRCLSVIGITVYQVLRLTKVLRFLHPYSHGEVLVVDATEELPKGNLLPGRLICSRETAKSELLEVGDVDGEGFTWHKLP